MRSTLLRPGQESSKLKLYRAAFFSTKGIAFTEGWAYTLIAREVNAWRNRNEPRSVKMRQNTNAYDDWCEEEADRQRDDRMESDSHEREAKLELQACKDRMYEAIENLHQCAKHCRQANGLPTLPDIRDTLSEAGLLKAESILWEAILACPLDLR